MDKFKTKRGRLTHYALACGYIETCEPRPGINLTLWHEGGPMFHVRAHDHNKGERIFWDSFEILTEARKRYDKAKRDLNAPAPPPSADPCKA